MWNQHYNLFGLSIGQSALIGAAPIFVLLILLGVLRKPAWIAALFGFTVAFVLAIGGYGLPLHLALSASANGAAFALFPISWIVFWAIALFRITQDTGKFEIIKDSIGHLTEDYRLQALIIAFLFGGFVEGAAGFGTPVAIAAAMLCGLGFSPMRAATLSLLANTAPVAFGSIGIPVITLAGITAQPLGALSAMVARLVAPVAFIIPFYLIAADFDLSALRGVIIPSFSAGCSFAVTQFVVATYIGPQVADIAGALVGMVVLVMVMRMRPPADTDRYLNNATRTAVEAEFKGRTYTTKEFLLAWTPYGMLVICVLLWGFKPFVRILDHVSYTFPWPGLDNMVMRMPPLTKGPTPYHAPFVFNVLSASGTSCMVATILSALLLRVSLRQFVAVIAATCRQLFLPTVTVTSVLAMAFLLNFCGATANYGLALAGTGKLFPFFSSILGWLGVFLTGSDSSANALFGNLQVVTASRLGLNPILTAAANAAGGGAGKMISLQTISIAAAATGMSTAEQSTVFRKMLKHSTLLAAAIGAMAMFYAYFL